MNDDESNKIAGKTTRESNEDKPLRPKETFGMECDIEKMVGHTKTKHEACHHVRWYGHGLADDVHEPASDTPTHFMVSHWIRQKGNKKGLYHQNLRRKGQK